MLYLIKIFKMAAELYKRVFAKKYFPTGSDKLLNIGFFWEKIQLVCKFEKKILPVVNFFFLRIPSPRILRQVGQGQISRSLYFL